MPKTEKKKRSLPKRSSVPGFTYGSASFHERLKNKALIIENKTINCNNTSDVSRPEGVANFSFSLAGKLQVFRWIQNKNKKCHFLCFRKRIC